MIAKAEERWPRCVRRSTGSILTTTIAVWLAVADPSRAGENEAVVVAGLRDGESARETSLEYPGSVPDDGNDPDLRWLTFVADAQTGAPIPHATIKIPHHAGGGTAPEDLYYVAEATADATGWVRSKVDYDLCRDLDYVIADAAGYAPMPRAHPWDERVELVRGVDVPIVVLDATGAPVADAVVGYHTGCWHLPDQRTARTDAHGRATIPSIDPNEGPYGILVESSSAHFGGYQFARGWRPGDPPVPIHTLPGRVVSGRVVTADGAPVPRAFVSTIDHDRPSRLTDSDGRFRLSGVEPWAEMVAYLPPNYASSNAVWFTAPPSHTSIELTIPPTIEPTTRLTAMCVTPNGEPVVGVRASAVRTANGATYTGHTGSDGSLLFELPAGRYRILVDGELGPFGDAEAEVTIGVSSTDEASGDSDAIGPSSRLEIVVRPNPVLRVDTSRVPDDASMRITTRTRSRDLDRDELARGLPVPVAEPAFVRVSGFDAGEHYVRYLALPKPSDTNAPFTTNLGADPLVIEWVPATTVTARATTPDGAVATGVLVIEREATSRPWSEDSPSTLPQMTTRMLGSVDWTFLPEDHSLARATGTIHIPEGGGSMDLDTIRLEHRRPEPADPLGSLEVYVQNRVGIPLDATLIVDERVAWDASDHDASPGRHRIDAIPDGRHRVIVSSPNHLSQIIELNIENGELRKLDVRLNLRDPAEASR